MVDIGGKYYKIDMDNLMSWVSETPSSEKNTSTITTLTYPLSDDDGDEFQKEISENKSTLNDTMNNIRYDFARNLLNTLFTSYNNELNEPTIFSIKDLTFGQKLAFNSLIAKNIINEIK